MSNPSNGHFKVDWKKIDLGDLITITTMLVAVTVAYGDLRADIRANDVKTQAKFDAYDKQLENQKRIDQEQNERTLRVYGELQKQMKEVKDDIRGDIKDLKTDIAIRTRGQR